MSVDSISEPSRHSGAADRFRISGTLLRSVADGLREHALYLAIVPLYGIACILAAWWSGGESVVSISFQKEVFLIFVGLFAFGGLVGQTFWVMFVQPPTDSLFAGLGRRFRDQILRPREIVGFLLAVAPVPVFLTIFGSFKQMIPFIAPYSWDPIFLAWDRAVHGGRDAWELLQPVLGTPIVTSGVNFVYHLWLFVLFLTLLWQCWTRRDPILRMQFLLSFQLGWIVIGTGLAIVFASGGPVYFGRLTGLADPYVPLMNYLYEVRELYPVWALDVQEMLWTSYETRSAEVGRGISAFPSMHVASSVLFALLGWRVNRKLGIAYSIFALCILLGSVHLGWHYAIDGYAAVVLMIAIWYGVGWGLRRWAAAQAR